MAGVSDLVWSGSDTSPGEVEAALRELLAERHADDPRYVPARALNLVCIVDREWRDEVANRLREVGRYHASRTIVCAVEAGRTSLDAVATLAGEADPAPASAFAELRETILLSVGERHMPHLASIVDPIIVSDLATVVWSPHGHRAAVDALLDLAGVVLLDSMDEPDVAAGLTRARSLSERAYVVDLAWLRSTPWRERIAAAFDPPALRLELAALSAVTVRHHPESAAAGLLLLGWRGAQLARQGGMLTGKALDGAREVALALEPVEREVRGLTGVTIATAAGDRISLDRGAGGLAIRRETADAAGTSAPTSPQRTGTMLGASRGEPGNPRGGHPPGAPARPDLSPGPRLRQPSRALRASARSRARQDGRMTEVVLLRHAETEWSRTGRHTGRSDILLTEDGRAAARALAGRLAHRRFAVVLTSPLSRAAETARLAGLDAAADSDLVEWDYGEYEGLTTPQVRARRPEWSLWRDGCPGGEGPAEVGERVDSVIARVLTALTSDDPGDAAIVAHGHVLRVLGARWCELDPAAGARLRLETGTLSVLGWERETPVIRRWNAS